MSKGVSKYALKVSARNRMNGGLIEGKNPPPLPTLEGYIRNYYSSTTGNTSDVDKLLPNEKKNQAQIHRFRTSHRSL